MKNEKAKQTGVRIVGGVLLLVMGFSVLAGTLFYLM